MGFQASSENDVARAMSRAVSGPQYANNSRLLFESEGEKATLLPVQELLHAEVQERKAQLAQLKDKGRWTEELLETHVHEVSEAYYMRQEQLRAEVDEVFAEAEKQWRKGREPIRELLSLQRWQQKYGRMTVAELDAEIERYVGEPAGWDPDEVDTLEAAAIRAGTSEAYRDMMRNAMAKADYAKPWLQAHELVPYRRLHDLYSAGYGEVKVLSPLGVDTARIAELFDDSEIDEHGMLR